MTARDVGAVCIVLVVALVVGVLAGIGLLQLAASVLAGTH